MRQLLQWKQYITSQIWTFKDVSSNLSVDRLNHLLHTIIPNFKPIPFVSHGYHLLFNNQDNRNLGSDGYDNYQAPIDLDTRQQLFKRRIWVKGEMQFAQLAQLKQQLRCQEKVVRARHLRHQVFVEIDREITSGQLIVSESRVLMYTNEPYQASKPANVLASNSASDSASDFLCPITISLSQVLQYSFLTQNLHKIHIDDKYARSEGYPECIVQGPFMCTIMLGWFNSLISKEPKSFKYKNVQPIVANESVKLMLRQKSHNVYKLEILGKYNDVRFTGVLTTN